MMKMPRCCMIMCTAYILYLPALISISCNRSSYQAKGLYEYADAFDDDTGRDIVWYAPAIKIYMENYGLYDMRTLTVLFSVASVSQNNGLIDEAEKIYKLILELSKRIRSEEDRRLLRANSLAALFLSRIQRWDRETAEDYLMQLETELSSMKSNGSALDLGDVFFKKKYYQQAIEYYQQAISGAGDGFGVPPNSRISYSFYKMAQSWINLGNYDRAIRILRELEKFLNPSWSDLDESFGGSRRLDSSNVGVMVAEIKLSLARHRAMPELYKEAEALLASNIPELAATQGPTSRRLSAALEVAALLMLGSGREGALTELLTWLQQRLDNEFRALGAFLTLSELENYIDERAKLPSIIYTALATYPKNRAVLSLAMTLSYMLKGISADEEYALSEAIHNRLPSDLALKNEELMLLRMRYQNMAFKYAKLPSGAQDSAKLNIQIIAQKIKTIIDELVKVSVSFRRRRQIPALDAVRKIAQAVPADHVLLEFILFPKLEIDASSLAEQYLVIALTSTGVIASHVLGSKSSVDHAIANLLEKASTDELPELEVRKAAQHAYQVIFAPLMSIIGDKTKIIIAPDGELNDLPFSLLHDGHDYLLERYEFRYENAGRDLLRQNAPGAPSTDVVIFADPAFRELPMASPEAHQGPRRLRSQCKNELESVSNLPGTRREAVAISQLLPKPRVLLGREASEWNLFHLQSPPGILHLATHGLLLHDPACEGQRGAMLGRFHEVPGRLSNPLLRSGLLLAGAELSLKADSATIEGQDGVATAFEIAGMNLWGTQLVVLSACNSGRGEKKMGQGVYGLRRAMLAAGAETLLTSLWKVPDEDARELMTGYYQRVMRPGTPRITALRLAQLSMRKSHPHPYYWASFIGLGSNEALRGFYPRTAGQR